MTAMQRAIRSDVSCGQRLTTLERSHSTGTLRSIPDGAFNASVSAPGTYTFKYTVQNCPGNCTAENRHRHAGLPGRQRPGGQRCYDGTDKTTPITDYRWIIEEDRTFYVDPNKTTNTCPTGSNCSRRPDLRHELPHQLHAGHGGTAARERCPANTARAALAGDGGVRRAATAFADPGTQQTAVAAQPGRALIRANATTFPSYRGTRPIRSSMRI